MYAEEERPPSLLEKRPLETKVMVVGALMMICAHVAIPTLILASQQLLVLLGLALPVGEQERTIAPQEVIAAEFVKLGKPFDPTKLPQRKVPPKAKRKPDGVVVSPDAKEHPEKKEEKKEKPKESEKSLLDNLVDRTKDFAEDVQQEEQGDPAGVAEGTAEQARLGNIYLGQLTTFFKRGWAVPTTLQNPEKLVAIASVRIGDDGKVESVEIQTPSGEPEFDYSVTERINELIKADATIPTPPPGFENTYFGKTLPVRFRGSDAR